MLKSISLKCPNCGANLEITSEMSSFSCGYCGASQMVERSGGTVSLRLLSEGIARVQAGTDKTAAELAIRRLKEELQIAEATHARVQNERYFAEQKIRKDFTSYFLLETIAFALVALAVGGWFALFVALAWIAATVSIFKQFQKNTNENEVKYDARLDKIDNQINLLEKRINENTAIIGY